MKIIKWILIGLGLLFFLWVFGVLFKVVGFALSLVGIVISAASKAMFNKVFWVFALGILIVYLLVHNKKKRGNPGRHSARRSSRHSARNREDHYEDSLPDFKIGELDRRLDRLNDILSRHH